MRYLTKGLVDMKKSLDMISGNMIVEYNGHPCKGTRGLLDGNSNLEKNTIDICLWMGNRGHV